MLSRTRSRCMEEHGGDDRRTLRPGRSPALGRRSRSCLGGPFVDAPAPLRRPAAEPPPRLRGALAPEAGQGLLHDRVGRAREQRGGRPAVPDHRSGAAPLPFRRLLRRSSRRRRYGQPGPRRPAESHLGDQRPHVRRTPQGVRPPGPRHHPADVDDRLPPAQGGRPRLQPRPGSSDRPRDSVARGRDRGVQLRRRIGEPLDGRRGLQRGRPPGPPQAPLPGPVRLRGQRHRPQHEDAGGVDGSRAREPSRPPLLARRRIGPGFAARRRRRVAGLRPREPSRRRPSPGDRAIHGPRRVGRRERLPDPRRDRRRPRP